MAPRDELAASFGQVEDLEREVAELRDALQISDPEASPPHVISNAEYRRLRALAVGLLLIGGVLAVLAWMASRRVAEAGALAMIVGAAVIWRATSTATEL